MRLRKSHQSKLRKLHPRTLYRRAVHRWNNRLYRSGKPFSAYTMDVFFTPTAFMRHMRAEYSNWYDTYIKMKIRRKVKHPVKIAKKALDKNSQGV